MIHLTDKNAPLHERLEMAILLAVVGGFLDSYSFLCYGGVFANAQTGNMVLLGISLINGDYIHFINYLIPIIAFSLGILMTEYLLKHLSVYFYIWILIIEIIILFAIAFIPDDISPVVVTAAISFMCSIQIGGFRKVCGSPYASTMCTGNLRSAMEQLFLAITVKNSHALSQSIRYFIIILFFCIGGVVGAIFIEWWGKRSILACSLLFFVLLLLVLYQRVSTRSDNS